MCCTELNINEHTELGSNETIKEAKTDMSRSGRKPVKCVYQVTVCSLCLTILK